MDISPLLSKGMALNVRSTMRAQTHNEDTDYAKNNQGQERETGVHNYDNHGDLYQNKEVNEAKLIIRAWKILIALSPFGGSIEPFECCGLLHYIYPHRLITN